VKIVRRAVMAVTVTARGDSNSDGGATVTCPTAKRVGASEGNGQEDMAM